MRKKSMFSTVLVLLVIAALATGGYTFFKDMDGPAVQVTPNTGRVSPATVLQIHMNDPSGIRSLTVGIRKNNVLNVIFNRHFDEYLPERVVDVPLKDSNLRHGRFVGGFRPGQHPHRAVAHASGHPAAAHFR